MVFKRLPDVEFIVKVEHSDSIESVPRFAPGETVKGTVELHPRDEFQAESITVALGWHTEGRGDTDRGTGPSVNVYSGMVSAGGSMTFDFELTMPTEPWSYGGQLIQILWGVEVTIDVAERRRHVTFSSPLVLAPHGWPS